MRAPNFTNRTPVEIITETIYFDSVGFVFRGLSWLDYAKRTTSVVALQYAALETRQTIEHLFFEELGMSVGGDLDREEYEKCKSSSTKLGKITRRLNLDYQQLVAFTRIITSLIPNSPPLIEWDHNQFLSIGGAIPKYLHWPGEKKETYESSKWFVEELEAVENAANYLWRNMKAGHSGIMTPENMEFEIRQVWEDFKSGRINLESVHRRANIALPALTARWKRGGEKNSNQTDHHRTNAVRHQARTARVRFRLSGDQVSGACAKGDGSLPDNETSECHMHEGRDNLFPFYQS